MAMVQERALWLPGLPSRNRGLIRPDKNGSGEMQVQEWATANKLPDFPSVISTPNVCGGSPRLIRTRIPLWVLHRMRQHGFSEAKILESFPTLTPGDLAQAWAYIAMHKTEIEKEIEENEQD